MESSEFFLEFLQRSYFGGLVGPIISIFDLIVLLGHHFTIIYTSILLTIIANE